MQKRQRSAATGEDEAREHVSLVQYCSRGAKTPTRWIRRKGSKHCRDGLQRCPARRATVAAAEGHMPQKIARSSLESKSAPSSGQEGGQESAHARAPSKRLIPKKEPRVGDPAQAGTPTHFVHHSGVRGTVPSRTEVGSRLGKNRIKRRRRVRSHIPEA